MAKVGNPYHDAKGLFSTAGDAKVKLTTGDIDKLREKHGKLIKGSFSGHQLRKLRDKFGSTIKGGHG